MNLASPETFTRELANVSRDLDANIAADQALDKDKGKTKRTATNVISSSGVDTANLPLTVTQQAQVINDYEANIADINKIIVDIGSGSITVQQKAIINTYLPNFVASTNAKAKRVQEALAEMEKKLTDAKLQQGMTKVRSKSPMTANPAFEAPKGPVSGGGGARK
jgi:prefoldin subunit 5